MRKKLLSMLLCATMAVTMAGCGDTSGDSNKPSSGAGSQADSGGGSSETVNLRLWGAEEDQDYLKQIVDKFESTYSDQKFNIEIGVESESTAKDTVLTDIEAAADVYSYASDQLADLVRAGALAALDDVSEVLARANKKLDDVKSANDATLLKQQPLMARCMVSLQAGLTHISYIMTHLLFQKKMPRHGMVSLQQQPKGRRKSG